MKKSNLIPLAAACLTIGPLFFNQGCANTTTPPSGGPKDTIPPTLLAVSPLPGELNVPTHKTKVVFTFDEYVVVKDQKCLFLSPPQEKGVKYKLQGKSVVMSFEEDLQPSTTYTLDVTGAIADNNEGNMFPGYSLTFSTGDRIDSMYVTGTVQDCSTLKYVKGATVMLYKDQADSAIFLHRPDAAVKTDDWGFFCLRNIQDTCYRLYALKDENGNNMYDPETEMVAFADSVITPVHKVGADIYELYKFDMLDTLSCLKRESEHELNLFRGIPSKQMIVNKERPSERAMYVTFMAPFAIVDSIWIKGVPHSQLITQFDRNRDSLEIWVNNPKEQPDTFFVNIDYMKTDSTNTLVKTLETIKMSKPKEKKNNKAMKSSRKDIKHEDTIAVYKVEASGENFEQYGVQLEFEFPLVQEAFDSVKYIVTNPRQKKEQGSYTWERDSTNLRRYIIRHKGKIQSGYEYEFTIPHRRFKDINGHWNDSTVTKITLPDDDKLSRLQLNVCGVEGMYIVDIMTEKEGQGAAQLYDTHGQHSGLPLPQGRKILHTHNAGSQRERHGGHRRPSAPYPARESEIPQAGERRREHNGSAVSGTPSGRGS